MKITMTTTILDAAKCPPKGRVDIFDAMTAGLNLRVTEGRKSWSFVYTAPGTSTRARLSLGTYPATTLKDARTRAIEARGHLEGGIDPRNLATAAEAPKTIAQLVEERLSMEVRGKLRRAAEMEWRYNKYVLPLIGKVPVKDFKIDPHYNRVKDPIVKRGKMRMAGMVYQDLNGLFQFAIERGTIEFSQMARVKRPDVYVPRDIWLKDHEIKTLWDSLPTAIDQSPAIQRIIQLLLATGQRLQEVAGIARHEIDLKAATWTLPAARAKNGYEHVIPLNAVAVSILRSAMRDTNGKFLFPNKKGDGPQDGRNIDTTIARARSARTDAPLGKFGVASWRPHDLRRTVATHMSKLGVPHLAISHVLNHVTNTKATITQAVYDKHDYMPEKREALDKWGAFLAQLIGAETGLRVVA